MKLGAPAGKTYSVQASTNLVDWETISVEAVTEDGLLEFEDADAVKHPYRFYRVLEPWDRADRE